MIEMRDLEFAYAEGEFKLQVKNLEVAHGQRVCWVGPSGSGKTTLLHLVAGIFSPHAGQVKTCGEDLTSQPEAARRSFRIKNIGLVFQDFALLDYLSVLDNILLPYRINRALQLDTSVTSRAEQLAASVGLGRFVTRRPTQLSQGERQRVAICRAIVTRPQLVLADEPTANLDAHNANRVLDALEEYAAEQGATLIVVSHDSNVVTRFNSTTDVSAFCVKHKVMSDEKSGHA